MTRFIITTTTLVVLCIACDKDEDTPSHAGHFEGKEKVTVTGYADHLMEPFLSRDGNILLFNNSNDPAVNTNIHWATRVDDVTFEYQGEIDGINSDVLDGVPSMDLDGNLYFVSIRNYASTLETAFGSAFDDGSVTDVAALPDISLYVPGWVNFDIEVDPAGETLYFVDGRFDEAGGPYEADIVIAKKVNGEFQRLSNSDEIMANINTADLEYAACISANSLELYFTRIIAPLSPSSDSDIFVATRSNVNDAFGVPVKIESITGFAEGPTISPDGKLLYYHGRDTDGVFSLYLTRKVE